MLMYLKLCCIVLMIFLSLLICIFIFKFLRNWWFLIIYVLILYLNVEFVLKFLDVRVDLSNYFMIMYF